MTIWGLNVYSPPTKLDPEGGRLQGRAGSGGTMETVSVIGLGVSHVCVNPPTQSA